MRVESWAEYVGRVSGGLTHAQIRKRTGIPETNIGRWLRGDGSKPSPDSVAAFARGFDQPVIEAMVAAGWIHPDDALVPERTPLAVYSTRELIAELARRSDSFD